MFFPSLFTYPSASLADIIFTSHLFSLSARESIISIRQSPALSPCGRICERTKCVPLRERESRTEATNLVRNRAAV